MIAGNLDARLAQPQSFSGLAVCKTACGVCAIIPQGSMTSIKVYADRGRRFASFSYDCLRAKFVSVIEAWALDLNRRCRRRACVAEIEALLPQTLNHMVQS